MRRSNFVIGLLLSVVAHGALVVVLLGPPRTAPSPPPPPPATPIQIVTVDPQAKMPLEQLPEPDPRPDEPPNELRLEPPVPADPLPLPPEEASDPKPQPKPQPAPAPAPKPAPKPADTERVERPPGRTPTDGDAEYLPPLRVHWTDAPELIAVARALGLRLAAVNLAGEIIGEIDLADTPGLRSWLGLPYGYSSRVRMLSPSIFASRLRADGDDEIYEIWVFVPLDRDRAMISAQRAAVRRAGASPDEVLYVDGRFVPTANGSYRLDITAVRVREQGRMTNG